jgi:hypothetical protein
LWKEGGEIPSQSELEGSSEIDCARVVPAKRARRVMKFMIRNLRFLFVYEVRFL